MRLENLYPNFGRAATEAQVEYISAYRLRRAEDMSKPSTYHIRKTTSTVKTSKIDLSDAEKALMKTLGLRQKDMILLKTIAEEEENGD